MFDFFKRKKRITTIINAISPLFYPHIRIVNEVLCTEPGMEKDEDLNIFIYAASTFFINNVFKITSPSETGHILIGVFNIFYPDKGLYVFTQHISDSYKNDAFRLKLKVHYQDFVDYLHDGIVDKNITHDKISKIRIREHLTQVYDIEKDVEVSDPLDNLQINEREKRIESFRSIIGDVKLVNFFNAVDETYGETSGVLKDLDNGKTLDDIFYTGDEYGYVLGVRKESEGVYTISFGCEYGMLSGGGSSWKVVFDTNDKVTSFVKGMSWDS